VSATFGEKLTSDRIDHDHADDDGLEGADDNGVLADTTSTTSIGILSPATAQVSVVLPGAGGSYGRDEDDLDDEIVADEVDVLADEDVTIDDEPDDASTAKAPTDEASDEASDEPSDKHRDVAGDAAGREVEQVVPAEDVVEPAEEVVEHVQDVAPVGDTVVDPAEDVVEPVEDVQDAGSVEPTGARESQIAVPVAPAPSTPAVEPSAESKPASAVESPAAAEPLVRVDPARPATRRSAHHGVAPAPAHEGHDLERVQTPRRGVVLASKRIGEFDVDSESADLLTADRLLDRTRLTKPEPEGAWRQFFYALTGGRINLGDSKRARARKALDKRIAAPLAGGARFVPVLSRKGGVGKTTVTALLGMALADARDDRIIAIDANPDRGTLADRIARQSGKTVRDLVREHDEVAGFNDVSTIVARDATRLDVLASESDPRVSEAFSDGDYRDVAEIAAHYYSIVLTDTGTGVVHSVMGATLGLANQIVVVSGLSVDEARLASETLTWLETNGFQEQVRAAVVVLNTSRPGTPLVRESELEAHFRTRVRTVVRLPYDPHIATGSAITFAELQPATRASARQLAVAVIEGLRAPDGAA
jgi:MinD-like ATPase involved in chromosome partitioning or flagellar assembly